MNDIPQKEKDLRKIKRTFTLVWSGCLFIIILPLISFIVSIYLNSYLNLPNVVFYPLNIIIGLLFLLIGFFWAGWSNIELYKTGKGTAVPLKHTQTTILVLKGPYKYTRNPMVFGYILIWVGLGFFFNSYVILIGFSSIVLVFLIIFIKSWEEKDLERRFGQSYLDYKKRVSMIIPLPPRKY